MQQQTVQIFREVDIDVQLDEAIRRTLVTCFPRDAQVYCRTRVWHGSIPVFTVLIEQETAVIAHLGIVDRKIRAGDVAIHVAGICNVCVLPQHRGKGLSDRILTAAMDHAHRKGFDAGLLFTSEPVKKVYSRNGWRQLFDVTVIRIEGDRQITRRHDAVTMYYPLKLARFPQGVIHLQGNDW